jgi:hypothetical protein
VITITGIGDHLRPEWPITITGMRNFDEIAEDIEAGATEVRHPELPRQAF